MHECVNFHENDKMSHEMKLTEQNLKNVAVFWVFHTNRTGVVFYNLSDS